ncbi:MAG: DNA topoisomerase I [Candidatus Micrarchaeota archaeon]|nr:DNA topoisomerase I [Candidatus Micrarchaeota archaeon]
MKLVICEKPKVAEKIAFAIGAGKATKKILHNVPYYEVERQGEKIAVVSAVGHLYTLRQAVSEEERQWPVFSVEWAPVYEVEKDADYAKNYLDAIKSLSKNADEFISACDFDIEGSLIGYNVIRFACGSNDGKRMKFSTLTPDELENAYIERGELDLPNALAGEARHILDWFYGINLSRALMSSIRSAGKHQIMSIGRVQGPALAILARKEKEIGSFVPQPYWEVSCVAKGITLLHTHGRFAKREEAQKALASSAPQGTVQKIDRKEYLQPAPPPFDLTSLQVEAYRVFGFAPALTLELAQSLYEASMISYPRTSSQKLPPKLNLKKIIEAVSKIPPYAQLSSGLLAAGRTVPVEGKKEDPAHPAIHPTGIYRKMSEREMRLYDLIVRRFLSCFGEAAVREAQKVVVLSGTETYSAAGNRTVKQGWLDIYGPYVKLEEVSLPQFSEGEAVRLSSFKMQEKKTQPPKRYTPASLVSELERLGLGTKATRAVVVETLFKRGYAEGASIKVTPFGMAVYDALSKIAPEILDEKLTRNLEEEMEKIQDGENEKKAIEDGKRMLEKILSKFEGKEKDVGLDLLSGLKKKEMGDSLLGPCKKCGKGELRVIRSKLGKQFVGCSSYPECTATYPLPQNAKIKWLEKNCPSCSTPVIRVTRKGKKTFEMCLEPSCETKKGWSKNTADNGEKKAKTAAKKGKRE